MSPVNPPSVSESTALVQLHPHVYMSQAALAVFRTRICEQHRQGLCLEADRCPHSHCQTWQRRNPNEFPYSPRLCPDIEFVRKGKKMTLLRRCCRGRECMFAHSKEEELYHPSIYKTKLCNAVVCTRYFCPFAHIEGELKKPTPLTFPIGMFANCGELVTCHFVKESREYSPSSNIVKKKTSLDHAPLVLTQQDPLCHCFKTQENLFPKCLAPPETHPICETRHSFLVEQNSLINQHVSETVVGSHSPISSSTTASSLQSPVHDRQSQTELSQLQEMTNPQLFLPHPSDVAQPADNRILMNDRIYPKQFFKAASNVIKSPSSLLRLSPNRSNDPHEYPSFKRTTMPDLFCTTAQSFVPSNDGVEGFLNVKATLQRTPSSNCKEAFMTQTNPFPVYTSSSLSSSSSTATSSSFSSSTTSYYNGKPHSSLLENLFQLRELPSRHDKGFSSSSSFSSSCYVSAPSRELKKSYIFERLWESENHPMTNNFGSTQENANVQQPMKTYVSNDSDAENISSSQAIASSHTSFRPVDQILWPKTCLEFRQCSQNLPPYIGSSSLNPQSPAHLLTNALCASGIVCSCTQCDLSEENQKTFSFPYEGVKSSTTMAEPLPSVTTSTSCMSHVDSQDTFNGEEKTLLCNYGISFYPEISFESLDSGFTKSFAYDPNSQTASFQKLFKNSVLPPGDF